MIDDYWHVIINSEKILNVNIVFQYCNFLLIRLFMFLVFISEIACNIALINY